MPKVLIAYATLWVCELLLKRDSLPLSLRLTCLWKRRSAMNLLDEEYGIKWIKNVRR